MFITYSYVGFETITILTEDITSVLNIEMVVKANDLDEIVIKSTNKESDYNKSKQGFSTSKGYGEPRSSRVFCCLCWRK